MSGSGTPRFFLLLAVVALSAPTLSSSGCGAQTRTPASSIAAPGTAKASGVVQASFVCEDVNASIEQPLRRLSRGQLRNTLEDLTLVAFPEPLARPIQRSLGPVLLALPSEAVSKDAPFSSMDQAVSQQHVDSYSELAMQTGRLFTQDAKHVQTLLACKAGQAPMACLDAFIRRFGRHVFRHALSDAEVAFLRQAYKAEVISDSALRNLLTVMLSAPQFLYQVDLLAGPVAKNSTTYKIHPYAIASRLAFHYWQTTPDESLLLAAERGQLNDEKGVAQTVDRMLGDPRAERSLRTFVLEWFDLSSLKPLDNLVGDPVFDAFAGEDLPSPDLREAMVTEVVDSLAYHAAQKGTYKDWFQSPYSFARNDELAGLYDVRPWNGKAEPPRFPPGQRAGLLTRAALLATGSPNTRPIMKGVFIRRRLMCDDLAPPPPNANNFPPALSPELTTREVVEALTQQPGSSCASCHAYQINPLGFATENYDALGRLRTQQRLFSKTGVEVAKKPINTQVVPRVALYDETQVTGPAELMEQILRSGKGEACFARQYVRFTYGRREDLRADGCLLEEIRKSLLKPNGLREALRAPALRPSFRQRTLAKLPSTR